MGISSQTPQEVLEERHYYPFGLIFEGPFYAQVGPENEYTYDGKRFHREGDLNWYDYGARRQDPTTARWWVQNPLTESMESWTPYNYTFSNPILYIDPDGRRVDVSDLMKGSSSDTELLVRLMANLSDMTGSKIILQKDEKTSKTYLAQGECTGDCESSSAADFVSFLVNDQSAELRVYNNERNTRKTSGGRDAKDFGSQAYASGDIYLDAGQIGLFQKSVKAEGLDDRTINTGMVFLHESLHTVYGASFYRKDGKIFTDPKGFEASYKGGETVDKVNVFRAEMGLPLRASYGGHNPSELRFQKKQKDGRYGTPFSVPIIK